MTLPDWLSPDWLSPAWLSLGALVVVMIVSCTTQLNVGVIALALAWVIGAGVGQIKLDAVPAGFPTQLFLTLVGVTLLFTQAQVNGTLDRIAHLAVRLCRGNAGMIPVMFFLLGSALGSLGPGNISTAALLGPMAMSVAGRAAIPPFLMAIMVGNGAQSAALSPFAPTGLIVNPLMMKIGLGGHEWWTYLTNLAAHAIVAFSGYLLLGGWKLFKSTYAGEAPRGADEHRFTRAHFITIGIILAVLAAVIGLKAHIGMAAFAGAVLLAALRVADHEQAIRRIPWTPIVMVSGVSVLVALLEKTGGLDLFESLLARFATPGTLTGAMAFVTGLVSVYSSTSSVVLPTFLPTVPGVIERLDPTGALGISALAVASSMNVGAHLVDMSPLSTTGAVCIAAIADPTQVRPTYNKLLAWGLSMTVIGAIGCYLFF